MADAVENDSRAPTGPRALLQGVPFRYFFPWIACTLGVNSHPSLIYTVNGVVSLVRTRSCRAPLSHHLSMLGDLRDDRSHTELDQCDSLDSLRLAPLIERLRIYKLHSVLSR